MLFKIVNIIGNFV